MSTFSISFDEATQKYKAKPGPSALKAKKKILFPLNPEEWKGMHGKAQWDSMVALRGPDYVGYETLKFLTTSVIRHRLSDCFRVGGLVNRQIPFIVLPNDNGVAAFGGGKAKFDYSHFLNHIQTAAQWLSIPIVFVQGETFKEAISTPGYTKALSILAKEIPSEFHEVLVPLGISIESGGSSGDSANA